MVAKLPYHPMLPSTLNLRRDEHHCSRQSRAATIGSVGRSQAAHRTQRLRTTEESPSMKKPFRTVALSHTSIALRDSNALGQVRGGLVSNFNAAPSDEVKSSGGVRGIVVNGGPLESW
jgi:hypothetical protein